MKKKLCSMLLLCGLLVSCNSWAKISKEEAYKIHSENVSKEFDMTKAHAKIEIKDVKVIIENKDLKQYEDVFKASIEAQQGESDVPVSSGFISLEDFNDTPEGTKYYKNGSKLKLELYDEGKSTSQGMTAQVKVNQSIFFNEFGYVTSSVSKATTYIEELTMTSSYTLIMTYTYSK